MKVNWQTDYVIVKWMSLPCPILNIEWRLYFICTRYLRFSHSHQVMMVGNLQSELDLYNPPLQSPLQLTKEWFHTNLYLHSPAGVAAVTKATSHGHMCKCWTTIKALCVLCTRRGRPSDKILWNYYHFNWNGYKTDFRNKAV